MKNYKKHLMLSLLLILVCCSMFALTTYAWFSDSVSSSQNIIQAGSLDAGLYWCEATEDPENANWTDASIGSIFNYDNWEPGYVDAKHLKITNEGNLAFNYRLIITVSGEISKLADVIDVYLIENAVLLDRDALNDLKPVGTIASLLAEDTNVCNGAILPIGHTATNNEYVGDVTFTVVLRMQTTAGNEYQGLSIGDGFSIGLVASQYGYEEDSFGSDYEQYTIIKPTDDLTKKLKSNGVYLFEPGEYTLPQFSNKMKNITMYGMEGAKIVGTAKNSSLYGITFSNFEFSANLKGTFYAGCKFVNCKFMNVYLGPSANVNSGVTLLIENCTFDHSAGGSTSLHFGGKDNGTVIIRGCKFIDGGVAFGKTMNVTMDSCEFDGLYVEAYGPLTIENTHMTTRTRVYIYYKAVVDVTITMNNCTVEGDLPVTSVCFDDVTTNDTLIKQFNIDGVVYDHTEFPAMVWN